MLVEHRFIFALGIATMPFPDVERCRQLLDDQTPHTLAGRMLLADVADRIRAEVAKARETAA